MELTDLPSELIPQYALTLDLPSINHLCSVNKKFSELCSNEHFWKMKFIHDYHFTPQYTGSWLKLYQNYNSLWTFGKNTYGQLGLGDDESRLIPTRIPPKAKVIAAGDQHAFIIDLNDNVWAVGRSDRGQLGLGDTQKRSIPERIPHFKAKSVSTSYFHTLFIDLDDNVWGTGANNFDQLGIERKQDRLTPVMLGFKAKSVSVGVNHSLIIDLNDDVYGFGLNDHGQLGLGDVRYRPLPTRIHGSESSSGARLSFKAKSIFAGEYHSFVIDLEDNVWGFGSNMAGQLGLGDTQDKLSPTLLEPVKAKSLSTDGIHTLLIDLEDNVWVFGAGLNGRLGLGNREDRLTPTRLGMKAKAVSAGGWHSLLIDLDENVWSFGSGAQGQLGLGDRSGRTVPTSLKADESRAEVERKFELSVLKAKAVAAGGEFSMLIATRVTS